MKKINKIKSLVLKDVDAVLNGIVGEEITMLLAALSEARRVYIAAAGRSLCVSRAFAKRLYQCGIDVYVCGDTNSPPAGKGDLMVACSRSGRTETTRCLAALARKLGCKVAAVTANPRSPLGGMSDFVVTAQDPPESKLQQPMGSLFEQSVFILFDCIIIMLKERMNVKPGEIERRHSNLE